MSLAKYAGAQGVTVVGSTAGQQYSQGVGGGATQSYTPYAFPNPAQTSVGDPYVLQAIAMRMRWPNRIGAGGLAFSFDGIMAMPQGDRVVVVVVNHGQSPVVFDEPAATFPSDDLIARLRLLES